MKDTLPLRAFVYNKCREGRQDNASFIALGAERIGPAFVADVALYKAFWDAVLAVWVKGHKPISGELYKCNKAALAFLGKSFSPDETRITRFVLSVTYWAGKNDGHAKGTKLVEEAWVHLFRAPLPPKHEEISSIFEVKPGVVSTYFGGDS